MKTRRTWRNSAKSSDSPTPSAVARVLAGIAGALRGRAGWTTASAAVVILGLLGVWLFVGGGQDGPPDPRARQYKDFDACLLTDEKGIVTGAPAAPVWEGMQEASGDTQVRVTFVPVMGEQTLANVQPFFNGLMQRQCDVVLASGAPQVKAVEEGAGKHPKVRFVVVDGSKKAGNVTLVTSGKTLKSAVADAVRQAVKDSGL
ncbi:BMP family ABC transporter substrate-binding protein [Streptomyces vilmorinianum]|uniref:BMP family ABC transporter substrate-binding protein n=1 Tax=Streptomyces vilmorinianum TaxID=3051092 RepID=UPI0010FB5B87|nr:BMP family ABC transporter substrate-binding protein [Streptomyces vilmorinianum]